MGDRQTDGRTWQQTARFRSGLRHSHPVSAVSAWVTSPRPGAETSYPPWVFHASTCGFPPAPRWSTRYPPTFQDLHVHPSPISRPLCLLLRENLHLCGLLWQPTQQSCLENPTDRGAWRATVHGVAKSQTDGATNTLTFMWPLENPEHTLF